MSRIVGHVRHMWRRTARAYHLICARDEVRALGLHTPVGVWFCDRCRVVVLDPHAVARHAFAHSG